MKLRLFATLRGLSGAKEMDVATPATVGELLSDLSRRWGSNFDGQIFQDRDRTALVNGVIVLVNGRHIAHLAGMETPLTESDIVDLFPPLAGG
ncbi:MoaD/ThiS family protein [Aminithiophilus ramosus]|uniref:MoaD/ThiS family protein n=1 Tax=Aminithiophilus ramosus TaxID=3029084 RepID=A0A9Q7ADJ8_9BACT|nr:ubiquitin-like small modifier protein 1 [Aminithiophilus ramosus]QTX31459.1 MoaD/ThiS family protein [Aminithiophilus ramosus]